MTELEAVNMLLRLIGSSPINSLSDTHPDASNAKTTLARIRKQAQRRGWWFNIEYNTTYTPDVNGHITIPQEISSVVISTGNYTQRGTKLYDVGNNTYIFTTDITAYRSTRILEWDDMPEAAQEYCGYFAASQFIRDELEDPTKQNELEVSAGQAMLSMKKQDLEEGRYNMFNNSRIRRARAGVRPYRF